MGDAPSSSSSPPGPAASASTGASANLPAAASSAEASAVSLDGAEAGATAAEKETPTANSSASNTAAIDSQPPSQSVSTPAWLRAKLSLVLDAMLEAKNNTNNDAKNDAKELSSEKPVDNEGDTTMSSADAVASSSSSSLSVDKDMRELAMLDMAQVVLESGVACDSWEQAAKILLAHTSRLTMPLAGDAARFLGENPSVAAEVQMRDRSGETGEAKSGSSDSQKAEGMLKETTDAKIHAKATGSEAPKTAPTATATAPAVSTTHVAPAATSQAPTTTATSSTASGLPSGANESRPMPSDAKQPGSAASAPSSVATTKPLVAANGHGTSTETSSSQKKTTSEPSDKGSAADEPATKRRRQEAGAAKDKDGLEFRIITNDGTEENLVWLINVKEIFAKQLPKMPKEYIVRLVMDRKHYSLVCIDAGHVIGGICFRPYMEQRFAEIAFLAVSAARQVKGVGTKLMNHLKQWVKSVQLTHFLTYADNFAIGYFRKQGFTKIITMPRERWRGYIKDYDGGTLMECSVNEYVDYLHIPEMIASQRKFLFQKIKQNSTAERVYPGLNFRDGLTITHLQDQVRGVREAGWAMPVRFLSRMVHHNLEGTGDPEDHAEYYEMQSRLYTVARLVKAHREAWPFQEPVGDVVADYLDIIRDPIDISLIKKRLDHGQYYKSPEPLRDDMLRMCDNCCIYNGPETSYYQSASNLRSYILNLFKEHFDLDPEAAPKFAPQVPEEQGDPNAQSENQPSDPSK
mmetsp:Transcript_21671/g.42567  ORF Transcript_21671/g.42567 Transcript_21671/m.42567 type:complete len:747 (+) Transcript_21671:129-2369(+)